MTKEEWEKLYEILDDAYYEFRVEYTKYKDGKNKQIRNEAERKVDNSIDLSALWIRKYPEAFDLLTGENATGFDRTIIWDEFIKPNWFKGDMPQYLEKIREKIKSL